MFKKMMLLAMAIAAVVAFAAPAMASASRIVDTETGLPAPAGTHLHYTGAAAFSTEVGGVACEEVTATIELESAETGKVVSFVPNTATCESSGALTGCQLSAIDSAFGWGVHTNGTDLKLTEVSFVDTFEPAEFCPVVSLSFSEMTVVLTNSPSLDTLDVSGTGTAAIFTGEPEPTIVGAAGSAHLTITPAEAGTWELAP